jgi:hypothetical protein
MFIWGHNLGIANLMANLKCNDECSVEYTVSKAKACHSPSGHVTQSEQLIEVPVVKAAKFGSDAMKPVVSTDKDFVAWLKDRKITEAEFQRWVGNQVNVFGCQAGVDVMITIFSNF